MEGVSFTASRRAILSGIDLSFERGEVSAVIGPSGSGKSTLLKCLTTSHRPTAGRVLLGEEDIWQMRRRYRMDLGYVPQDDIIHRQLTVRQAFRFSSRLRLDTGMDSATVDKRVESITELLGLAERRDARIRRLSGGQRKRVNIGIELLADPDILILDEPASGLDPGTEEDLVVLLKRLARFGRTVVLTTHSMEYLSSVDKIVLIMEGRVVFAGRHEEMLSHFGVDHSGEVFKALRGGGAEAWAKRFANSPLAWKRRRG